MKYEDFKRQVSDVLTEMGQVRRGMFKPNAVELICMICAHESLGGVLRVQMGGGPARGVLQLEEPTHDSIWDNSDTIEETSRALGITRDWSKVEHGDRYSIFMARHLIAMDPHPIPDDVLGMGAYAKRVWNTSEGKATSARYISDWMAWRAGEL